MSHTWARRWHAVTAAVTLAALLLQLALVFAGEGVLVETDQPTLLEQLGRYVSYFTIQSNALVAVSTVVLARHPSYDGTWWRVARLAGVVGIAVTGLVHVTLLRPLLDLDGWSWVADKMLHMVVPVLAVAGWAAFGPRPRVTPGTVRRALAWPLAWTVWTLVVGAVTGWFPYPFLDYNAHGWARVLVACGGITVLFLAFFLGALAIDRRAAPAPKD